MKKFLLLLSLVAVVALAGCTMVPSFIKTSNEAGVCTKEAKSCPDGSAVGREGPNCEFTPCPKAEQVDTVAAIKQLFIHKYNKQPDEVTVHIKQEDATHARGEVKFGVGGVGEGGIFLAAKVDGVWQLVFDGNGQIDCALVKQYSFPAEMIGDCYNTETADRKIYKNDKYKFEFNYPNDYTDPIITIDENNNTPQQDQINNYLFPWIKSAISFHQINAPTLCECDCKAIEINEIQDFDFNSAYQILSRNNTLAEGDLNKVSNIKVTKINNQNAISFNIISEECGGEHLIVDIFGSTRTIRIFGDDLNIVQQVANTFKFTK
ncbi:MAG: hypothetical protein WC518_02740 [Patescibacteria group bacterium]